MASLLFLIASFLKLFNYQTESCTDESVYYSESLNSRDLVPAFSLFTCPTTYLYLTDGNFTLSTALTIDTNEIAISYLEILPFYCEDSMATNCFTLDTRPTIFLTDSIVTFIVSHSLVIRNIIFSHKFDFKPGCSICDYCRSVFVDGGFYYNDRNELINDNEFLEQYICDLYSDLNFISVQSTGNMALIDVSFNDFRMQFSSLIYIDQGIVTLSNVDFYNIVVKNSVILSQSLTEVYSTTFIYNGGGIELLNNGYEFNSILGSTSFIKLTNFISVFIENLNIKNNIGSDTNYFIDLNNIYEILLCCSNLKYNILPSHMVNIDQKRISSYASQNPIGHNFIVYINDNLFSNNYAENLINFGYDLNFQQIYIARVQFTKNSVVNAIYYTSNFQDTSKSIKFDYFTISELNFEMNYINSLLKVFSVPEIYLQNLTIHNNGFAWDAKTEILNVIIDEDNVYLQKPISFLERQVDYFIYLSINLYSCLIKSEFNYNSGSLFYSRLSNYVFFNLLSFEYNDHEDDFIKIEDIAHLIIDDIFIKNTSALEEDAYFINFDGLNTNNYISVNLLTIEESYTSIYIAFSGEIHLEKISIISSKSSGLSLIDIKIKKSSVLSLKNCFFSNNTSDIIEINPAFGAVSLNFSIENSNFINCNAESKLINIGPNILIDNDFKSIFKYCEFSYNTGNIITIESSDSEISFENCIFSGNSVLETGMISGYTTTNISFFNSVFSQNSIILLNFNLNPNQINTFECVFHDNFGIIIQSIISDYYDYGSIFTNNLGSILKIQSGGSASLDSSKIISNSISIENSLVEVLSGSSLWISNVTVFNNTSVKKAILMIENDSGAIISDSIFESNSAYRGSAILIQHCPNKKVNITNVQFNKNNARLSGTIFILEGFVNIENCEFLNNEAIYSAGVDVIYSSKVNISNTKFNGQIGQGSCIKCQDSSEIAVFDSEFKDIYSDSYGTLIEVKESFFKFDNCEFKNVEFYEGYLILGENSHIYSTGTSMLNIKMHKNFYLLFFDKSSQIEVDKINIQSFTGSAIFVGSKSKLSFTNSIIQDGSSKYGTGVNCNYCLSINIAFSEFARLSADKIGGCVYINKDQIEETSQLSFCNFHECVSSVGGAIYLFNSATIITNSNFTSNKAIYSDLNTGQGGAIFQEYSELQPIMNVTESSFNNNFASISGGAIQWYSQIPMLSNTIFIQNNAYYGDNIGSFPFNFNFSESRALTQVVSAPGQAMQKPLKILILDHYNQIVLTDNYTAAELSFLNESVFIKGTIKVTATMGDLEFSDITVYGEPGFKSSMLITAESLLSNMPNLLLSIDIELRECIAGEVLINNNTCEVCKSGTYNFIPSTECLECPTGAKCKGGSEIYTENGYWRISKDTDTIFICPNQLACLSDENEQKCETGYKGNLCQACSEGYSRSAKDICDKCLDKDKNSLRISGILFCITLFLVFQTFSSINSAYKEQSINSIYLKILVNYLQLVGLTIAFDLDWPELVLEMFKIQGFASSGSEQFLSFDCFVAGIYEPYYLRLIIFSALPAISFFMTLLSWLLISCCRKTESVKEKIVGSIVLQLFFFHPMLIKMNFSAFNCRELLEGKYYLRSDMDIECWKGNHLVYSLAVAIPSICIYCIGLPFIFFINLYKYRGSLDKIAEKLKYNFLYKGYVDKFFYWESIIIMRKLLIIIIFVFLSHEKLLIQALCTFMVILISFLLQYKCQPFTHPSLNTLELQSITISGVTIYSGLYFLSNSLENTAKMILFAFMVLSNFLFISTWVYFTFSFFFLKFFFRFSFCRKIFTKKETTTLTTVIPTITTPDLKSLPYTNRKNMNSIEISRVEQTGWFTSNMP